MNALKLEEVCLEGGDNVVFKGYWCEIHEHHPKCNFSNIIKYILWLLLNKYFPVNDGFYNLKKIF